MGKKITSFEYLLSFIVVFEPPRREMWGSLCTIVLSIISLINGLCVCARPGTSVNTHVHAIFIQITFGIFVPSFQQIGKYSYRKIYVEILFSKVWQFFFN